MTSSMRDALKGTGGGLQGISSSVAESMSSVVDTRGSKQKQRDEDTTALGTFGDSKGATVEGSSINAKDQIANQSSGTADHLDLGFRKQ